MLAHLEVEISPLYKTAIEVTKLALAEQPDERKKNNHSVVKKKLEKNSARVPKEFHVFPNFQSCFYTRNSIETRYMFFVS